MKELKATVRGDDIFDLTSGLEDIIRMLDNGDTHERTDDFSFKVTTKADKERGEED